MYRKKSLRIFRKRIAIKNKYNITTRSLIFFFSLVYITYSDYLSLKNFSKEMNCFFFKKNNSFLLITNILNYSAFRKLGDLILFNDSLNYVSKFNKKEFKLESFPIKLKLLYCKFEEYILTREFIYMFFYFINKNSFLVEKSQFLILFYRFFINIYIYLYNFIVIKK